jgi:hypothetical protein
VKQIPRLQGEIPILVEEERKSESTLEAFCGRIRERLKIPPALSMDSPEFIDRFCLAVSYLVPAYVVLRFRVWWLTIPIGAFVAWYSLVLAGHALFVLDPDREGSIPDTLWLLFGWIPCLFCAGYLYLVRCLAIYGYRRFRDRLRLAQKFKPIPP